MRLPTRWRRRKAHNPDAARQALAQAELLAEYAEQVMAKDRRIIRENHLGQNAHLALGEARR